MSSFGENDLTGFWKSKILEQCDLCFKEGRLHPGLYSRVKADHKPMPGVQHARANFECPKTRKRSTAGTSPRQSGSTAQAEAERTGFVHLSTT